MTDYQLYQRGLARPRIYVSGPMAKAPYTGPRAAFLLAQKLWRAGWHPIVPHANAAFELAAGALDPASEDGIGGWLEYDFSMMGDVCFLVRITSEGMVDVPSSGTDREVALANHGGVGITVLTEEQALLGPDWCRAHHFVDVTGTLLDSLEEADKALREHFPGLDHSLSVGERIAALGANVLADAVAGSVS